MTAETRQAGYDKIKGYQLAEDRLRKQRPFVRIWDGDFDLQHILEVDYKSQFSWISNDTGPGRTEIPFDTPVAQWIHDQQGRLDRGDKRNVHITVDYCGARWSGRMDKMSLEQREDGDTVLVVDWLSDYENLKWYHIWSNPFLPALLQFPRAFIIAGPVPWVVRMALFLQIFREHNPLVTWPDDPLDPEAWFASLDVSTWGVVVKPESFLTALASGAAWGVLVSRWGNWHDACHVMLEDAELSVTWRRFLIGDPPPWEGAELAHGTLVIDFEDKSGVFVGTSNGGNLFSGLIRTFAEFADDFIDSTENVLLDTDVPVDYFTPFKKYTDKKLPFVIYHDGDNSPIQTSAFITSPAKGVQILAGGHSMPGVNEAISASIQAVGDIIGSLIQIGSLGGTIDTLLKPLYEDTILAWWAIKSFDRAQHSGFHRYFEYFQDAGQGGQTKAYTIASLMVLRAGFWATKTTVTWKCQVLDALPFLIGDQGLGHFFLDDRIGLVLRGDTAIHMDRCRKLDLAWGEDGWPEWTINIGDDRNLQDPAQRAFGRIESLVAGLRDLGVY